MDRFRRQGILVLLVLGVAAPAWARVPGGIAASKLPEWVRQAAAKSAPAASDADLVCLFEEKTVAPLPEGGVRVRSRWVARVLTPAGLHAAGSTALVYQRGDRILALRAWTLLPDGSARAADPDDAVDSPLISSMSVFEDGRRRDLAAPAVTVGGVVAFESEQILLLDRGAISFWFGDPDRPTLLSRLVLETPAGWGREATLLRAEGIVKEEAPGALIFTARDLAPLSREERRPAVTEILPTAWVRWWSPDGTRGYRDWDAVGRWFESLSAPVLSEPGEAGAIGVRLRPASPGGLLDAIASAFAFAARDVRYVSIQIGIGGYRPHTPAAVSTNRYGDCKDKAFLLRAIAAPWSIKTYPLLVRVRDEGSVEAGVPTPGQFNHAIAALALPEGIGLDLWPVVPVEGLGRLLLLDATARDHAPWDLPEAVQGTTALLVHPGGGRLVSLPEQPPGSARTRRTLAARLERDGTFSRATFVQSWSGSRAAAARGFYASLSADQVRRQTAEDAEGRFPGARVASHRIEGLDRVQEDVVATTTLSGGRLARTIGDLIVIEPGRIDRGLISERLPRGPRRWPLEIGAPHEESVEIAIDLPPGWKPEDLPPPSRVEGAHLSATSEWTAAEGRLVYRRSARLLSSRIPPEQYEAFRVALGRVQTEDARAIVLVAR